MLSFWQQDTFLQPADVVIAGGGFMGLWSAYALKKKYPKLVITILEKESLPGGASVRNAGFACFGSPSELMADVAIMGEETMWQTVEMRYKGIEKIRQVLGDAAIDYDACGGYECFSDEHSYMQVQDKLWWLNAGMESITGTPNIFTPADSAMQTFGLKNFKHQIVNRLEGGLHSGKTIQALLRALAVLGVTVLNGVSVQSWEKAGSKIEIVTSGAFSAVIKADQFLITTNAFVPALATKHLVVPARGQVLVTKPIKELALKGTFHYDEGFYYWRDVGNRILLGGARNQAFKMETTTTADTSAIIQEALKTFLHRHINLPAHQLEVDYCWAGIMGFTQSKLPVIQMIAPNVWAAIACNGMGVALTPIMAEKVAAQMMG